MFEGYVGIRLWSGQLMEDVWFSILFVLFFLFAIQARIHVKSFIKIFRNLGFSTSSKSGNTDLSIYYSKSLHIFLIVQALILTTVAITQEAYHLGFLNSIDKNKLLFALSLTFLSVVLFYLIRRIIYYLLIYTFGDLPSMGYPLQFHYQCMGNRPLHSGCLHELPWELSYLGRLFIYSFLYFVSFCNNL